MTKPSLHDLISEAIYDYTIEHFAGNITTNETDELAEQIIEIVRDYHLVEDKFTKTARYQGGVS